MAKRSIRELLADVRGAGLADEARATAIGDVHDGTVRIAGRVVGARSRSPATDELVAWCLVQAFLRSAMRPEGIDEETLATSDLIFDQSLGDAFDVVDTTGGASVACTGATVQAPLEDVTRKFAESPGGDELRAIFAERSLWSALRVLQWTLRDGDAVEIVGRARRVLGEATGYRAAPRPLIAFDGPVRVRRVG